MNIPEIHFDNKTVNCNPKFFPIVDLRLAILIDLEHFTTVYLSKDKIKWIQLEGK